MLHAKTGNTATQSFMGEVSSSSIVNLYFATNTQKGQAEEVMDVKNRIFLFAFAGIRCKLAGARGKTRLQGCGELHLSRLLLPAHRPVPGPTVTPDFSKDVTGATLEPSFMLLSGLREPRSPTLCQVIEMTKPPH
jgi:hypothetical protein